MSLHNQPYRRYAVIPFILLLALPVLAACYQEYQRRNQVRHISPVAQRAGSLCAAFSEVCKVVGQPLLLNIAPQTSNDQEKPRPIWRVECLASGRPVVLHLNAATRRLCSLLAQDRTSRTHFTDPLVSLLATPEDAVHASVKLLRGLDMVAAGGKIALASKPLFLPDREVWLIVWKVMRPNLVDTGLIRMELDRRNSVPVRIVDTQELNPPI